MIKTKTEEPGFARLFTPQPQFNTLHPILLWLGLFFVVPVLLCTGMHYGGL